MAKSYFFFVSLCLTWLVCGLNAEVVKTESCEGNISVKIYFDFSISFIQKFQLINFVNAVFFLFFIRKANRFYWLTFLCFTPQTIDGSLLVKFITLRRSISIKFLLFFSFLFDIKWNWNSYTKIHIVSFFLFLLLPPPSLHFLSFADFQVNSSSNWLCMKRKKRLVLIQSVC